MMKEPNQMNLLLEVLKKLPNLGSGPVKISHTETFNEGIGVSIDKKSELVPRRNKLPFDVQSHDFYDDGQNSTEHKLPKVDKVNESTENTEVKNANGGDAVDSKGPRSFALNDFAPYY